MSNLKYREKVRNRPTLLNIILVPALHIILSISAHFLYSFLIRNFIFSYEGWKRENVCNFLLVFILDNESCGDEATRSRTFLADRRVRILLRVSNKNHCCCYRFHKNSWDKDFFILSWTFRPVRLLKKPASTIKACCRCRKTCVI